MIRQSFGRMLHGAGVPIETATEKEGPRRVQQAALAFLVLLPATTMDAAEPPPRITFRQATGRVCVSIAGREVATYVYEDPRIPRPYLAHVCEPGGIQVTRNHPPIEGTDQTDHATMHPGIWMAFGDLDGTDIWRNRGRVIHERFEREPCGGSGEGEFAVRNRYVTSDGKPICREVCHLKFSVRPEGFLLGWDSTFSADRPFSFGDQEEMGLGVRLATRIAVKSATGGRILTDRGSRNEAAVWGRQARWCDYAGRIEGRFAGIAVMPHPDNFRPCWWHARDYGFLAANPFGRAAFRAGPPSQVTVASDETLRLRFGILVHATSSESELDLAAAYQHYLRIASLATCGD